MKPEPATRLLNLATLNAAKIALHLQPDGTHEMQGEDIADTAINLARIELSPGFDWATQPRSWEYACERLAYLVSCRDHAISEADIRLSVPIEFERFDRDKALAGHPVCTRDGTPVVLDLSAPPRSNGYSITGTLPDGTVCYWKGSGAALSKHYSSSDLVMQPANQTTTC